MLHSSHRLTQRSPELLLLVIIIVRHAPRLNGGENVRGSLNPAELQWKVHASGFRLALEYF